MRSEICQEGRMRDANSLIKQDSSITKAAQRRSIPYPTLRDFFFKQQRLDEGAKLTPNYEINRVFSAEQEVHLLDYLFECITNKDCRLIAYQMAQHNQIRQIDIQI